jgi:membrane-associated phospholipid phosphatase
LRLWGVYFNPYELVRDVCNFLIPAQLLLWIQEPLLRDPARPLWANLRASLPFFARSGLIVAVVVVCAKWGKYVDIWPAHPGFPSGHATTCAALTVVLVAHRGPRWAWLLAPMTAVMPAALVLHGAHDQAEVIGGLLFGTLATAALWRLTAPRTEREVARHPVDARTGEK